MEAPASRRSDVDCGGSCGACPTGKVCNGHTDCLSATCSFGICRDPACDDDLKNGQETDVDCGGKCPGCGNGQACQGDDDCESGDCADGSCISCDDGVKNGSETAVDCGGSCGKCATATRTTGGGWHVEAVTTLSNEPGHSTGLQIDPSGRYHIGVISRTTAGTSYEVARYVMHCPDLP